MNFSGTLAGGLSGEMNFGSDGDTIDVNPIVTSGTKIATLTVNAGTEEEVVYDLYAPDTLSWDDITDKPTLFSGSYGDLTNKPTLNGSVINGNMFTNNYSTNEQRIGTWIDGKPLYQRTFYKQYVDSNDGLIETESNVDFKYVYGTFRRTEDNALIMLPFQATSVYCRLYAEYTVYGGILLETNMIGSGIVTAIYTKTTD